MEVVFSQANHPHANGGWVLQRRALGKDGITRMVERQTPKSSGSRPLRVRRKRIILQRLSWSGLLDWL
jgi:hypothetical protein